jgi:hypothetical protein
MLELPRIIEDIRSEFTAKNAVRDTTLNRSRELIRFPMASFASQNSGQTPTHIS